MRKQCIIELKRLLVKFGWHENLGLQVKEHSLDYRIIIVDEWVCCQLEKTLAVGMLITVVSDEYHHFIFNDEFDGEYLVSLATQDMPKLFEKLVELNESYK